MNNATTPPAAAAAPTTTTPAATAQAPENMAARPVIRTPLGIEVRILGRGVKVGEVLVERVNDGARRIYLDTALQCEGGIEAVRAEIARVCAGDKQL